MVTKPEGNRSVANPENVCPKPAASCRRTELVEMLGSIFKLETEQVVLVSLAGYLRQGISQLVNLLRFGVTDHPDRVFRFHSKFLRVRRISSRVLLPSVRK